MGIVEVLRHRLGATQLYCDSKPALYIAGNLIFHEQTNYMEIHCHFVREKLQPGDLVTYQNNIRRANPTDLLTTGELGILDPHMPI